MNPCLHLGAVGWDYDAWEGSFYPDDLPRDWRLEYYANEFSAVLVPAGQWGGVRRDLAEQWREDLPERFRFHLQMLARHPLDECAWSLIDVLRPRIASVLLCGSCCEGQFQRVREQLPDAILAEFQGPGLASVVEHGWQPGVDGCAMAALGVVPPAQRELPQLRALLESFGHACRAHSEATLFFAGQPPDVDELRNAATIAGLLGVV